MIVEAEDTPDPRDVSWARRAATATAAAPEERAGRKLPACLALTAPFLPALPQLLATAIRAGDVGRVSDLLLSLPPPPPLAFGLLQACSFGNRDM